MFVKVLENAGRVYGVVYAVAVSSMITRDHSEDFVSFDRERMLLFSYNELSI